MSGLPRVLLLSPPSLSSNPDKLAELINQYDKNARDLQMLDRLAAGLVSLPESTYNLVLLLTGIDGTNAEGERLVGRDTLQQISRALQSGGVMKYQDGSPAAINEPTRTEAILCGFTVNDKGELMKPAFEEQSVSLSFSFNKSRKPKKDTNSNKNEQQPAVLQNNIVMLDNNTNNVFNTPDGDDDEELIDEDELIDADELERPIIQPPECRPKAGKRRRACKDCTCGLAQKLQAEDKLQRANADEKLSALKLNSGEIAEVDFTVQGKTGSCGNCSLGDAFRCDGCPYIGLPPFKPGEEVKLFDNDVQL
ncbi:TPA_exp: Fe-S cluster assembly protein DRE2 [Trichophyton benhamiae CBS 112371]|nr:TPA_exp: Fe-S cluster assembly protein DRE2 [Trichophyton benhamiae CBS 112371]